MIPNAPEAARMHSTGSGRRNLLADAWKLVFAWTWATGISLSAMAAEPASTTPESRFLRFDSVRSSASFEVRVLLMFSVDGQFGSVSGGVHIENEQARVEAAIDANAVSMNRESNEKWVKSTEFFDVDRHPQIFFESAPFPLDQLRQGGALPGTLNMRGVTRPVEFVLEPAKCEQPALDCPVVAHGTVRRSEFGMTTRRGALSDKVELNFSIRVLAPAAGSAQP
ncbi:YceI family protein [Dokdonella sp.]|uniref:YceI family protein n=1 Tax=Dokdonella sp. TaxID=2291710 RepID=UPI003528DB40